MRLLRRLADALEGGPCIVKLWALSWALLTAAGQLGPATPELLYAALMVAVLCLPLSPAPPPKPRDIHFSNN